ELPDVLKTGRVVDELPGGGVGAEGGTVVNDRDVWMHGADELRSPRGDLGVVGGEEDIDRADFVVGAGEVVLLVPVEVAEVHQAEAGVGDHHADGQGSFTGIR